MSRRTLREGPSRRELMDGVQDLLHAVHGLGQAPVAHHGADIVQNKSGLRCDHCRENLVRIDVGPTR